MGLDLNDLEKKLDDSLKLESKHSFSEWLNGKRKVKSVCYPSLYVRNIHHTSKNKTTMREWIEVDPSKENTINNEDVWGFHKDRKEIHLLPEDTWVPLNMYSHYMPVERPEPPSESREIPDVPVDGLEKLHEGVDAEKRWMSRDLFPGKKFYDKRGKKHHIVSLSYDEGEVIVTYKRFHISKGWIYTTELLRLFESDFYDPAPNKFWYHYGV